MRFLAKYGIYKLCTIILLLNAEQLSMSHSFWFIDGYITIGHVNECPMMHVLGWIRSITPPCINGSERLTK